MTFDNEVTGSLEVLPDGGHTIEQYDLFGEGFHVQVRAGGVDTGEVCAWEEGKLALQVQPVAGSARIYCGWLPDGNHRFHPVNFGG
jgi:hypothetical protein